MINGFELEKKIENDISTLTDLASKIKSKKRRSYFMKYIQWLRNLMDMPLSYSFKREKEIMAEAMDYWFKEGM